MTRKELSQLYRLNREIEQDKITLVSDNPVVIDAMPEIGYNPMDYLSEELK